MMQKIIVFIERYITSPWISFTAIGIIFLCVVLVFFFKKEQRHDWFAWLFVSALGYRIIYALTISWAQYDVWSKDPLSKNLLPPVQSIRYFLFYAWSRFWLNLAISLAVALLWYGILKALERYRASLFDLGEIRLGLLCALLVGWPGFVFFIPLSLLSMVFIAIGGQLFFKKQLTTIGSPMLLGAFVTLVLLTQLLAQFHLEVLKI